MRYPNSNKTFHKKISHANRGMVLEELINEANRFYLENDIAVIYKKPTPIGIVEVKSNDKRKIITKAFFKEPSTLDYSGIYRGKYIEFDAKETKCKTSFPLANISKNQINHMKNVINHGGISFLIIKINDGFYFVDASYIINFIESEKRKSIPFSNIEEYGYKINRRNLVQIDYIKIIDKIIGGIKNEVYWKIYKKG